MTKELAARRIRNAGIAASLITTAVFAFTLFSFISHHRVIDAVILLVPAFLAFLTYRIFRRSRAAIIAMSVIYIGTIGGSIYIDPSSMNGSIVVLFLVYFLLRGVEGALAYHKHTEMQANT